MFTVTNTGTVTCYIRNEYEILSQHNWHHTPQDSSRTHARTHGDAKIPDARSTYFCTVASDICGSSAKKSFTCHPSVCSVQATKTQRERERDKTVLFYSFSYLGARLEQVVNATPRPLYPREMTRYPFYKGWVGPRARMRKISPPSGIRSPDRPPLSDSLH